MKRLICIILALILVCAAFSGCSAFEKQTEDETVQTSESDESLPSPGLPSRTIKGKLASFITTTLGDDSFSSDSFSKYDVTIINFWGTYCGPCIAEMPDLAKYKETLPENVNFITFCVDGDRNEEAAQKIIDKAKLKATVIVNANGDFENLLNQIQYIPTTIFVDKNGKIVGTEIIGVVKDLEETYNTHLNAALKEANGEQ